MKIWARLMKNSRNVKDVIYSSDIEMDYYGYEIVLREISTLLDIPCPITMHHHFLSFSEFNLHKFKPHDFVESFAYDTLDLECFE